MKLLIVLAAVTALCAGSTLPFSPIPGDNSHYVEGESQYIWMPDGEGVPHLVDLFAPVPQDDLETRNGANNQYWLFTRQNPTSAQVLTHNNIQSVTNSNYRGTRPTKVLVHGWNGSGNSGMNPTITSAFLANQDCNVIVVDWRGLANGLYTSAVSGVPSVGQFLGNFIVWLATNTNTNWNNIHFVGFSLGAHVVGNAGRTAGNRASRVTGLDPAGPLWSGNGNALRPADGQYVEAIHTDGGLLGIFNRVANADFYPNGGRNPQPGCNNSNCSHGRAPDLFAATVRNNHLVGRLCNNLNAVSNPNSCTGSALNLGNGIVSKRGSGIFALTTGGSWPF